MVRSSSFFSAMPDRATQILVVLLGLCSTSLFAAAEPQYLVYSTGQVVIDDTDDPNSPYRIRPGNPTKVLGTTQIRFSITYDDVENNTQRGFDDPEKGVAFQAVVERVLEYIDSVLDEIGAVDIQFEASVVNPNSAGLAQAGPFFSNETGFTNGIAFTRIRSGRDLNPPDKPEIVATVNFGHEWFVGDGVPAQGEFDLFSVLLHELTHGLGFLSLTDSFGNSQLFPGVYTTLESLLERGDGTRLFGLNIVTAVFQGTAGDLTSNDVFFAGPAAIAAFRSRPPIYAPSAAEGGFDNGSSISHFDDDISGNVVMSPIIFPGTNVREYADFELGALKDLGYTLRVSQPPPIVLDSIDPAEGPADGGTSVTLSGNFQNIPSVEEALSRYAVTFGGVAADFELREIQVGDEALFAVANAGALFVVTPPEDNLATRTVDVRVSDPSDANRFAGLNGAFTYFAQAIGEGEREGEGEGEGALGVPFIELFPSEIEFGDVTVGQNADTSILVSNLGTGDLDGEATALPPFHVVAGSPYRVLPDGEAQVVIRFAPETPGAVSAFVVFTGASGVALRVAGTGLEGNVDGEGEGEGEGEGDGEGQSQNDGEGEPQSGVGGEPQGGNEGEAQGDDEGQIQISCSPGIDANRPGNRVFWPEYGDVLLMLLCAAALTASERRRAPA